MKYKFTVKGSTEAIGYVDALSKVDAEIKSSAIKRLSLSKFLELFEVHSVNGKQKRHKKII